MKTLCLSLHEKIWEHYTTINFKFHLLHVDYGNHMATDTHKCTIPLQQAVPYLCPDDIQCNTTLLGVLSKDLPPNLQNLILCSKKKGK